MLNRSGYRAVPLGDFDRFQQSSTWLKGSQRSFFSPDYTCDLLDQVQRGLGAPQRFFSQLCHQLVIALVFLLTILTFPISGWFVLKSVPIYERVIVFRLGRIRSPKGPGLVLLLPFIDYWQRVDLRTRAFSIPPCKLASQDGALVSIGADVQFHVCDPVLSVMTVKDLNMATRMTAQNVMTKILLKKYLREIQTEKLKINDQLLLEINDVTKSWGLEVDRVELILEAVLQVPPDSMATAGSSQRNTVCGVQGLDNTIQQLALHIFGKSLAAAGASSKEPSEVKNTLCEETPSLSPPADTSCAVWEERKPVVDSTCDQIRAQGTRDEIRAQGTRDEIRAQGTRAQVEHVEVQSEIRPPAPPRRTMVQNFGQHFDPEEFLITVDEYLSESLVNQVRACYQFNVLLPSGEKNTYFIDLSTGHGRTGCGPPDRNPDVVLEMAESDLGPLVWGDLNPVNAYVSGKLRAQGDLSKALKLELLFNAIK